MGRQESEKFGHAALSGRRLEGAEAALHGVDTDAAEVGRAHPDAGELGHHGRTRDEGHRAPIITTTSHSPSMSAGPETTGPVTAASTGTTPEQAATAAAAPPHPCRASIPSVTSAPLEDSSSTKGTR